MAGTNAPLTATRYLIVEGDEETGSPVVSQMGGIILYDDAEEVNRVAARKARENGGTYYVQKLITCGVHQGRSIN